MTKKRPASSARQSRAREGSETIDPRRGPFGGRGRSPWMRRLILPAATGLIMLAACQPAPDGEEGVENIAGEENEAAARPSAPEVLPSRTPEPDEIGGPDAPTPVDAAPGPIPPAYRGTWAIEAKDCAGQPGMTRIRITPAAIGYYEGQSDVSKAAREGSRLTLDIVHHAEGVAEKAQQIIDLSADGKRLSFHRGGTIFAYRKCG